MVYCVRSPFGLGGGWVGAGVEVGVGGSGVGVGGTCVGVGKTGVGRIGVAVGWAGWKGVAVGVARGLAVTSW
jgi:hypothetical protein